jgi:hypothetical protein
MRIRIQKSKSSLHGSLRLSLLAIGASGYLPMQLACAFMCSFQRPGWYLGYKFRCQGFGEILWKLRDFGDSDEGLGSERSSTKWNSDVSVGV